MSTPPPSESALRSQIAELGASFFTRRLTFGRTGNISARSGAHVLLTPTGASLGSIDPAQLSIIEADTGRHIDGPQPSKEAFLHATMYRARPQEGAVIHLHSTYSVAVSCLADVDAADALPPLTAYYVMRVGKLPLLPYHAPGDDSLAAHAETAALSGHAMLLANHGPVISAADLAAAADAVEELEETARLFLMLRHEKTRPLTIEQAEQLRARFPSAPTARA